MTTNISAWRYGNFALFSCFVEGHPAAAIVAINGQGDNITLTPLLVSVTDARRLTDHDGCAPSP